MLRFLAGTIACLAMTAALVYVIVRLLLRRAGPLDDPDPDDMLPERPEIDRLRHEGW